MPMLQVEMYVANLGCVLLGSSRESLQSDDNVSLYFVFVFEFELRAKHAGGIARATREVDVLDQNAFRMTTPLNPKSSEFRS